MLWLCGMTCKQLNAPLCKIDRYFSKPLLCVKHRETGSKVLLTKALQRLLRQHFWSQLLLRLDRYIPRHSLIFHSAGVYFILYTSTSCGWDISCSPTSHCYSLLTFAEKDWHHPAPPIVAASHRQCAIFVRKHLRYLRSSRAVHGHSRSVSHVSLAKR